MISLLSRIFVRNREQTDSPAVRRAYGSLCSITGIFLNLLLFAGKYFAGVLSGSIAITADAFNNLSDAGSSLITLIGFRFAGRRPDKDHPFGHGRFEYIAGLAVAAIILLMGVELLKSSVEKILHPTLPDTGLLPLAILAASILVKLYMFAYNRGVGRKIHSSAMTATATDSLSDAVATAVVLVCSLVARQTGLLLDGWCGLAVAAFILFAGYGAAKDTLSPLLGQAPDPAFVEQIRQIVEASPVIIGIHDLMVHDYGPGRRIISLHGEVPADGDMMEMHDAIDLVERELREKLGCDAVIHMDPIRTDDTETNARRAQVLELAKEIDPRLTVHDFRMVPGPTHTNLIFDVVMPPDLSMTPEALRDALDAKIRAACPGCFTVITVDQAYA